MTIIEMQVRNGIITPNEARAELGYQMVEQDEADRLLVSKGYSLLSDV
jgi:hypothetical protein